MSQIPKLIAILGPTGSGKSDVAEALAKHLNAQLISADAFMVYRGLDIGTNKPPNPNKYELLNIVDPTYAFGLGEYVHRFSTIVENLWTTQTSAVVVGGTGLYVRAVLEGYSTMHGDPDPALREQLLETERTHGLEALVTKLREVDPETAAKIDLKNPTRVRRSLERALDPKPISQPPLPPFQTLKFAVRPEQEWHEPYLLSRLQEMWLRGWPDEVLRLLNEGVPKTAPGFRAIGYHHIIDFLDGKIFAEEANALIHLDTRRYAKRQRTWLRSEPRLTWMDRPSSNPCEVERLTAEIVRKVEECS